MSGKPNNPFSNQPDLSPDFRDVNQRPVNADFAVRHLLDDVNGMPHVFAKGKPDKSGPDKPEPHHKDKPDTDGLVDPILSGNKYSMGWNIYSLAYALGMFMAIANSGDSKSKDDKEKDADKDTNGQDGKDNKNNAAPVNASDAPVPVQLAFTDTPADDFRNNFGQSDSPPTFGLPLSEHRGFGQSSRSSYNQWYQHRLNQRYGASDPGLINTNCNEFFGGVDGGNPFRNALAFGLPYGIASGFGNGFGNGFGGGCGGGLGGLLRGVLSGIGSGLFSGGLGGFGGLGSLLRYAGILTSLLRRGRIIF